MTQIKKGQKYHSKDREIIIEIKNKKGDKWRTINVKNNTSHLIKPMIINKYYSLIEIG
jgi:hypothetical protein